MKVLGLLVCALLLAAPAVTVAAPPRNAVTAGKLVVERPTLIALGFEWYVDGDDDGDATVAVSYRRKGATAWQEGLPLLRINRIDRSGQYGPAAAPAARPNLFAGSIFDLEPGSDYEVRFVMADPDGAAGGATRLVNARTRAEPKAPEGGRVFHVYPPDHKGPVQQPAFIGLMAAYLNASSVAADHYNVYPVRVRAGDTILMHAGVYKDDWHYYASSSSTVPASGQIPAGATCCGATFHGTYFLTGDGTPEKPIAIKAAGDGEVIFDGDGNDTLFNLVGGNHHYFEGITFRHSKTAIQAGWKDIAGSTGLTVKNSKFEDVGVGVHTDWAGAQDFYIVDNIFIGRNNRDLLVPFRPGGRGARAERMRALGTPPEASELKSEYAVKVYGSGHVIAFNRVEHFHDGFDHATYGVPEGWPNVPRDRMPAANDFYNNIIFNAHDDCIEVDGMLYNARVLRNLCVNAAGAAFSTQGPGLHGPSYFIRNVAYHVTGGFGMFKSLGANGIFAYNNTLIGAVRSNAPSATADFRNNLIFAEFPEEPAFTFARLPGSPLTDYNGYFAGREAPGAFVEVKAASGPAGPGGTVAAAQQLPYPTLAAWQAATGQDRNSRMVDYGAFGALKAPDVNAITRIYDLAGLDFRLRQNGSAVDSGTRIANVTEGFAGKAPDLGAIEFGASPPHYGPRR